MPLGLEDHELPAHVDLYERRQQSIKRMKSRSPPSLETCSTTKLQVLPSGCSTRPSPPPPYKPKHIEHTKAKAVESSTNTIANDVVINIVQGEQLPPYTAGPSSTQRHSWSRRLFDPRPKTSVPAAHVTSLTNSHAAAGITTQQAPTYVRHETGVISPPDSIAESQKHTSEDRGRHRSTAGHVAVVQK